MLYLIGVGAGSRDCITLGAINATEKADIVFVPVKKSGEKSTALEIIKKAVKISPEKITELEFPMTRDSEKLKKAHTVASEKIISALDKNKTAALITLGDVSVYSTASYIGKIVRQEGFDVETISAVPSFVAAANAAGISLAEGDETVIILPAANMEKIEKYLDDFDTLVIMKAGGKIRELSALLKPRNLENNAVVCSDIGMETQKISRLTDEGGYGYFTTVILRKNI